jgi:hypothetical protein
MRSQNRLTNTVFFSTKYWIDPIYFLTTWSKE